MSNINRNVILERDFLQQHGVRLYFDLGCLQIDGCYVPLEEDVYIASIARLPTAAIIKPQTADLVYAKLKKGKCIKKGDTFF